VPDTRTQPGDRHPPWSVLAENVRDHDRRITALEKAERRKGIVQGAIVGLMIGIPLGWVFAWWMGW
jgi:hypothetical protein